MGEEGKRMLEKTRLIGKLENKKCRNEKTTEDRRDKMSDKDVVGGSS